MMREEILNRQTMKIVDHDFQTHALPYSQRVVITKHGNPCKLLPYLKPIVYNVIVTTNQADQRKEEPSFYVPSFSPSFCACTCISMWCMGADMHARGVHIKIPSVQDMFDQKFNDNRNKFLMILIHSFYQVVKSQKEIWKSNLIFDLIQDHDASHMFLRYLVLLKYRTTYVNCLLCLFN